MPRLFCLRRMSCAGMRSGCGFLARCGEFVAFLSSSLHVSYAQFRRPERFISTASEYAGAVIEHGRRTSVALYREIEQLLPEERWVLGEQFSIADVYLFPFFLWGQRLGLTMSSDCPRWTRLSRRLLGRLSVERVIQREAIQELVATAFE